MAVRSLGKPRHRRLRRALAAAALLLALPLASPAAELVPKAWLIYPVRWCAKPPTVDGDLSDAAWRDAVLVSGFTISGSEALAPCQMTMRLLRDEARLYIAVTCDEPTPDRIVATARGRDAYVFNDDCIEWFIDPGHTHDRYFQFGLNTLGAMWDSLRSDNAWDCEWTAAVRVGERAWSAEIAIDFSGLASRPPRAGEIWGFNLCRERQASGQRELYNWANVFGNFHRPALFGHLIFLAPGAQITASLASAAAKRAGRPAMLFDDLGFWAVDRRAKFVSYRDALREVVDIELGRRIRELRRAAADLPELRALLADTARAYYAARAATRRDINAYEYATLLVGLSKLRRQLPEIYWHVKLEELLRSM